eukprot:CAMPEP_0185036186 /NCGR_PEP_ID=MMETSP1103-20130426/28763_1 /TAXON_ID=36769 /ORGANISM="Paraphysomonas bandaiensis, Strain Caron Lab Isolate" /LENGTH=65 /DNA_ID=CAMNT_0027573621 /DNA_START=671 /DNA_END=868 /DNA_ORIENTATION=+
MVPTYAQRYEVRKLRIQSGGARIGGIKEEIKLEMNEARAVGEHSADATSSDAENLKFLALTCDAV